MRPVFGSRGAFAWMGALTLVLFGGGGLLLIEVMQERDFAELLFLLPDPVLAMASGAAYGLLIAGCAAAWLDLAFMHEVRDRYARIMGPLLPGMLGCVWLAVCAGIGEELFFRGAVQHWLGIPVTSVLFVAIHGYLDPRDLPLASYGLLMTGAMIGLGAMAQHLGLVPAMIAHTVIDIVLLHRLRCAWRRLEARHTPVSPDQA